MFWQVWLVSQAGVPYFGTCLQWRRGGEYFWYRCGYFCELILVSGAIVMVWLAEHGNWMSVFIIFIKFVTPIKKILDTSWESRFHKVLVDIFNVQGLVNDLHIGRFMMIHILVGWMTSWFLMDRLVAQLGRILSHKFRVRISFINVLFNSLESCILICRIVFQIALDTSWQFWWQVFKLSIWKNLNYLNLNQNKGKNIY